MVLNPLVMTNSLRTRKWPSRNSGFAHSPWWFSIAMFNYKRVQTDRCSIFGNTLEETHTKYSTSSHVCTMTWICHNILYIIWKYIMYGTCFPSLIFSHSIWHSINAFYLGLFWHAIWHPFWHLLWLFVWRSFFSFMLFLIYSDILYTVVIKRNTCHFSYGISHILSGTPYIFGDSRGALRLKHLRGGKKTLSNFPRVSSTRTLESSAMLG